VSFIEGIGSLHDELGLSDKRAVVYGLALVAIAVRVHLVFVFDLLAGGYFCRSSTHFFGHLGCLHGCLLSVHRIQDGVVLYLDLLENGGHCGCCVNI